MTPFKKLQDAQARIAELDSLYNAEIEASVEHGEAIKALKARIAKLEKALEKIANLNRYDGYASIARAALTKEQG